MKKSIGVVVLAVFATVIMAGGVMAAKEDTFDQLKDKISAHYNSKSGNAFSQKQHKETYSNDSDKTVEELRIELDAMRNK